MSSATKIPPKPTPVPNALRQLVEELAKLEAEAGKAEQEVRMAQAALQRATTNEYNAAHRRELLVERVKARATMVQQLAQVDGVSQDQVQAWLNAARAAARGR